MHFILTIFPVFVLNSISALRVFTFIRFKEELEFIKPQKREEKRYRGTEYEPNREEFTASPLKINNVNPLRPVPDGLQLHSQEPNCPYNA